MKIGVDIRALMEGKITGVQVYILNLLEALFEIDKENEYVLFGNGFTPLSILPLMRGEWGKSRVINKIFRYPNKLFVPAQKFLNWPKVDKLLGGINLFFSPHWRIAALSSEIPLVITFHDLSFEVVPEFFTLKQRLWHKFMNYRQAAKRANKIIAVSENSKRDLVDIYEIPESKIKMIYPGAGNHYSSSEAKMESRISWPARTLRDSDYFLYFGTFEPRKNVESVLAAYERYFQRSQIKRPLVLAGSTGWKTMVQIPKHLQEKISVFREVGEAQKAKLFQGAFAFLFLSFYEGFGFSLLEAANAGLPVISSFATSLREIGHEFALMVNPFRPGEAADAMLILENEPEFYDKLKTRGLKAAKKFSWEKTALDTLEVFKEFLK